MPAARVAERESWIVQRERFIRSMHRLAMPPLNVLERSTLYGVSAWPAWTAFVAGAFRKGLADLHALDASAFSTLNDEIATLYGLGAS